MVLGSIYIYSTHVHNLCVSCNCVDYIAIFFLRTYFIYVLPFKLILSGPYDNTGLQIVFHKQKRQLLHHDIPYHCCRHLRIRVSI